ncbi:MAG: type II secretion system protein J [Tenuifilaceae bacterium]
MIQYELIHSNRRVKAFTIIELMVAMVIFVTVISLGLLLWSNVNSGIGKIQKDSEVFYEYVSFITTLEKDFSQAVDISNSGIQLDLSNDIEDISYVFHPDSIIRSINNRNTKFNLKVVNYDFKYFKSTDLIDWINLRFILQGKEISCLIYKSIKGKSIINTLLENGN